MKFENINNVFTFATEAGCNYIIAKTADVTIAQAEEDYAEQTLTHYTYTKRHISIGENKETIYRKALDGVLRDWYVGNVRHMNHTVYKFDFTQEVSKVYYPLLEPQASAADMRSNTWCGFVPVDNEKLAFTPFAGYGFTSAEGIELIDRGEPDVLRRDLVSGTGDAEFVIEAPRGEYEMFVCSGDENEDSVTLLEAVNGRSAGGEVVKKGEYQCKILPLVNESDDDYIRLKVSTKPGYRWKLNYIVLNAIKGY